MPGSTLNAYELPQADDSAVRVIVDRDGEAIRVYLHPQSLDVLKTVAEDDRFMRILFRLHGELLLGNRGSALVELAASWTIIMILTGLYLWWPRGAIGLRGVVFPRLGSSSRVFWRDIHAVTGVWISGAGPLHALQRPALGEVLGRLLEDRPSAHRHGGRPSGLDERGRLSP